ncbi:MAG: hypothetical protein WDN76_01495 [Alphaproteobacteria bacterium]
MNVTGSLTSDEVHKLHLLAKKGMSLKAISKAMTRTEESIQIRAKADGLSISKLR